jgi:L-fucose isomerase-like protein
MYDYRKLTLGIAPTRRDFFPAPSEAQKVKGKMIERIRKIASAIPNLEIVDIDWLNGEGMIYDSKDVEKVARCFEEKKIDALFMPHANFGQEEPVGQLGKRMGVPFLLWGPRDEAPPADPRANRQTDIQCGLFASSRALKRYGVPFTYIENCWLDSPVFADEFERFIRTASAVKAFRHCRVGQLSVRPRQFLSVKVNEGELMERFGIEIVPIESTEVLSTIREEMKNKDNIQRILKEWESVLDMSEVPDEQKTTMAAAEAGILKIAEAYDCTVMASECWSMFGKNLNIRSCFVFGDLSDHGLPTACETDIHGAITQAIVTGATRYDPPVFLADVTIRHPTNDNAELFWHCGPFPKSLAREGSKPAVLQCHGQYELRHGDITICRFDADRGNYQFFVGEGRGVEGPATNGNYVWVEVDDWVKWEKKLIDGPYIHHTVGAHGKYKKALVEACKYMNGVVPDVV